MMHILRWAVAAVLLAPSVLAQNPTDVSLTLAVKGGRAQFRVGEAVEVELQFKSLDLRKLVQIIRLRERVTLDIQASLHQIANAEKT